MKQTSHPRADELRVLTKAQLLDLLADHLDLTLGEGWSVVEAGEAIRPRLLARDEHLPRAMRPESKQRPKAKSRKQRGQATTLKQKVLAVLAEHTPEDKWQLRDPRPFINSHTNHLSVKFRDKRRAHGGVVSFGGQLTDLGHELKNRDKARAKTARKLHALLKRELGPKLEDYEYSGDIIFAVSDAFADWD